MGHLLFRCPIAMVTWCWVRNSLGWPKIPSSIDKFQVLCLNRGGGDRNKSLWVIVSGVGWVLWKTRNDLVFSKKILKSPKQVAYKSLGFLNQWQTLAKKEDRDNMEEFLLKMKEGLSRWWNVPRQEYGVKQIWWGSGGQKTWRKGRTKARQLWLSCFLFSFCCSGLLSCCGFLLFCLFFVVATYLFLLVFLWLGRAWCWLLGGGGLKWRWVLTGLCTFL